AAHLSLVDQQSGGDEIPRERLGLEGIHGWASAAFHRSMSMDGIGPDWEPAPSSWTGGCGNCRYLYGDCLSPHRSNATSASGKSSALTPLQCMNSEIGSRYLSERTMSALPP